MREFSLWLEKHNLTRASFSRLIGMANASQVSGWNTKGCPSWVRAYTELYDEAEGLKARVAGLEANVGEPVNEDVDEARAEEKLPQEVSIEPQKADVPELQEMPKGMVMLPELTGMQASIGEGLPLRKYLIENKTSATWWVRAGRVE